MVNMILNVMFRRQRPNKTVTITCMSKNEMVEYIFERDVLNILSGE